MEMINTDLLVIGSGIAGLSAALEAGRKGLDVVIVEKRKVIGGNSRYAAGIFACHETGDPAEPTIKELYNRVITYHRGQFTDPMIIKTYLEMSEGTIDWLKELGLEFQVNVSGPNAGKPNAATSFNIPKGPKKNGIYNAILAMRTALDEIGIRIFTEAAATELIMKDGRASGAYIMIGGEKKKITSRAVLVATGGFTGNKEWLKKYYSYYRDDYEGHMIPLMGDGLKMLSEVGAGMYARPGMVRETMRDWAPSYLHFPLILALKQKGFIAVNKKGRRVINENYISDESNMTCNILDQQPDGVIYIIYDDRLMNMIDQVSKKGPMGKLPALKDVFRILDGDKKAAIIAEDLQTVSDWIGCDKEELQKTIDQYNLYAASGDDRDFYRNPDTMTVLEEAPYYVLKIGALMIDTIGPVKINYKAEVLDAEQNVIPGLYCAGVQAGGWSSDDYCARYQFGSCIGFSCNYGRVAGIRAAEYIFSLHDIEKE